MKYDTLLFINKKTATLVIFNDAKLIIYILIKKINYGQFSLIHN